MEVQVGEKSYTLTKVNLKMQRLYEEIADMTLELSLLGNDLEDVADQAGVKEAGAEGFAAKAKIRMEMRKSAKSAAQTIRAKRREIVDKRDELIRLVLEKNGYEYDAEAWAEDATIETMNDIVVKLFKEGEKGGN